MPFLAAAVLLGGCGSSDDRKETTAPKTGGGGATTVSMKNIKFTPHDLTVKSGQKITWTNDDAAAHTVTAKSGGELDSGNLAQGASFSFTPERAGTIEYFCAIHPTMLGTIEVSE